MKNAVVVLPTYNERDNIAKIIYAILSQSALVQREGYLLSILVVDDSSPDGTGELVSELSKLHPSLHLLSGIKQGLGAAYVRGFKHAIHQMKADVVFEMDADFSHDPHDVPRLLHEISLGSDFVIGSRYISGGAIPQNWSFLRKANSKWGNIFARYVAGLGGIKDCTGGYRAINVSLLSKINLDQLRVKGYAFQMSLLHEAKKRNARIMEVPITFTDRVYGKSKLAVKDIREFVLNAFLIRFPFLKLVPTFVVSFLCGVLLGTAGIEISLLVQAGSITVSELSLSTLVLLSLLMIFQSVFTIYLMLYAWEDTERAQRDAPPHVYAAPHYSFSAIIPARHEEKVIADTLQAVASINYPDLLKEIIVVCREDDTETIAKVQEVIRVLGENNIRLVIFSDMPINKPHSLNVGLGYVSKDIVVIFDAEDQPHQNIYSIVNTALIKRKADVVQAGVQLVNFRSRWFSTMNVLEYFFWFKSTLHYFAKIGIIPLGGNTVFFKRTVLDEVGGWDEQCLTEDADIGIRLSAAGAKFRIIYSGEHATQEETPADVVSFIKQRTRWNQGFIQVLFKGEWLSLPKLSQRILAFYILTLPEFQAALLFMIPLSLVTAITLKLPLFIAMLSIIPLLLLLLQLIIYNIGLYEFTKEYRKKYPLWMPLRVFLTFYPFQILLGWSALRALVRVIKGHRSWEKTQHLNSHRTPINITPTFSIASV